MFHDEFKIESINYFVIGRCVSIRFKGGGEQRPPTSNMADTETRKYARETLYPMVSRGLEGEGFGTGSLNERRSESLYSGVDTSFKQAKSEFDSQMARTIDPEDTRVKGYLSNTLEREYITKKDDISRGIRAEKVADIDFSQGVAADYLAGEKRMTVQGAQMYNNALQRSISNQQTMGTFGSNVASGVGSGVADYYFAQQMGKG